MKPPTVMGMIRHALTAADTANAAELEGELRRMDDNRRAVQAIHHHAKKYGVWMGFSIDGPPESPEED